jgi:frataxin-like iron-binding protein CyaY
MKTWFAQKDGKEWVEILDQAVAAHQGELAKQRNALVGW